MSLRHVGGPRARGIHGEIKVFKILSKKLNDDTNSFYFLESVYGSELNTGFGTTIVGADLDGDGTDELIVGEPYRTVSSILSSQNGNCVLLFCLHPPPKYFYHNVYPFTFCLLLRLDFGHEVWRSFCPAKLTKFNLQN